MSLNLKVISEDLRLDIQISRLFETLRSNFKIESPSSMGIPVLRVNLKRTTILKGFQELFNYYVKSHTEIDQCQLLPEVRSTINLLLTYPY